ncbi:MAG: PDZ domain-containing protein [Planctomycetota bacterium]
MLGHAGKSIAFHAFALFSTISVFLDFNAHVAFAQATPEKPLSYWLEQLGSDQYLRRQKAERNLVAGGQETVTLLKQHLSVGDLETVERIISILAKIAVAEEPWRTDGAIAALESIVDHGFGAKASLAASTLKSFIEMRDEEARAKLLDAGVFVGDDEIPLGSRSTQWSLVRINDDWNGDVETLAWLRWLGRVKLADLSGPKINADVVEAVSRIPGLSVVVFDDCEITSDAIEALVNGPRLSIVEIRYSALSESALQAIAKLRLRESLHLMGTQVPKERVLMLRSYMPGVEVTLREGGFLGVICRNTLQRYCEVSEVIPGGGADLAGLRSRDIVVQIDDVKIKDFDDLQRQINTHKAGDELTIRYKRRGQIETTKAKLQRQKQR